MRGQAVKDLAKVINWIRRRISNFQPLWFAGDPPILEIPTPDDFVADYGQPWPAVNPLCGWWNFDLTGWAAHKDGATQPADLADPLRDTWIETPPQDDPEADPEHYVWRLALPEGRYRLTLEAARTVAAAAEGDFIGWIDHTTSPPTSRTLALLSDAGEAQDDGAIMPIHATVHATETNPLEIVVAAGCRVYSARVSPVIVAAINFQPRTVTTLDGNLQPVTRHLLVPPGFTPDYGLGYDDARGFGWTNTGGRWGGGESDPVALDASSSAHYTGYDVVAAANHIYRTFIAADDGSGGGAGGAARYWRVKLPTGSYAGVITFGDLSGAPRSHQFAVGTSETLALLPLDGQGIATGCFAPPCGEEPTTGRLEFEQPVSLGGTLEDLHDELIVELPPGSTTICSIVLFDLTRDSDGDGLSDAVELQITGTDPEDPDTNNDGLDDATEARWRPTKAGVEPSLRMNPLDADSDDDGILDGEEGLVLRYGGWLGRRNDPDGPKILMRGILLTLAVL